eukprot:6159531-Prymnesium_polylepis.1
MAAQAPAHADQATVRAPVARGRSPNEPNNELPRSESRGRDALQAGRDRPALPRLAWGFCVSVWATR